MEFPGFSGQSFSIRSSGYLLQSNASAQSSRRAREQFEAAHKPRRRVSTESWELHPAVVLNLGYSGLAAIRSLGRRGILLVALDSNPDSEGYRTRFAEVRVCPDHVHRSEAFLDVLMDIGARFKDPAVLFPASDAFTTFACEHRILLSRYYLLALPPPGLAALIVDKNLQYEAAQRIGVPYPRTFAPSNMEDAASVAREIEYPAFIKPKVGHLWRQRFSGNWFKVNNPDELLRRYDEILPTGLETLTQLFILGPATNSSSVAAYVNTDGECLALFLSRKHRQNPAESGVGTLVESFDNPELASMGLTYLSGIGYRGIAEIEFKKDDRDGVYKYIELNPRLWIQAHLASSSGVDFPLIQYLDLTGQKPVPVKRYKENVFWLDSKADLWTAWRECKEHRLTLPAWTRSWWKVRSHATFALDDLAPFFADTSAAAASIWRAFTQRRTRLTKA